VGSCRILGHPLFVPNPGVKVSTIDFRTVFDRSPNAYMLLDRQFRYVGANAAYLRATASRIEDLLGRNVFEVFPHDAADPSNESAGRLRESLERVLYARAADVLAVIKYRVPRIRDGVKVSEDRFWSATHTPLLDDDGDVAFILQHTVEVTELQGFNATAPDPAAGSLEVTQIQAGLLGRAHVLQAENQLLDTERQHLRRLFEQAPGFMCFLRGPDHVFEIANKAYYQLVGHRDIIGKAAREALPELEDQGYFELLDRVHGTGERFVGHAMPVRVQREPGGPLDELFVDILYQPIVDATGAVAGVFAQGHDITELKRLEAETVRLLERERSARGESEQTAAEQRFLAESIPQQVWTARPNGDLDFVNRRVVDYFGAPEEAILGRGWEDVLHPDDLASCVERWTHSLRTGDVYDVEFRLRGKDGSYRWHIGRALALRGEDGAIVKWFGTNTDVDEVRRTRDELQSRAEYEQQIIGIVSHDLRNPMNVIAMAGSLLLQRGRLDDLQGKTVARIVSSTERAMRLIRDFLDYTQARSAGQMPVRVAPANIRELARQVFDELHLMHPDRTARLEHRGEETGSWDADRIVQLLGNLIGNAFQHSGAAGVVTVVTEGRADDILIEVHNGGDPIPAEYLGRVFEPFQRGAGATASAARSVGLGLFISKQIVLAHGGTIDVRSTGEEGTVFRVVLPRHHRATDSR
jgi:PAS domain S-box-containing protein